MIFALAFVLNLVVFSQCRLLARNVGEKRTTQAWDCKSAVSAYRAAPALRQAIIDAILRRKSYQNLAYHQFAWLYLAEADPNTVIVDNQEVGNVLATGSKNPFPMVGDIWPENPRSSNFLFGTVSSDALRKGPTENEGHAEHKILENLELMRAGFQASNNKNCPCYVILSSTRDPCNDESGSGCAYDYVEKKNTFTKTCPNTAFYFHVGREVNEKFQATWEATKKLYSLNHIGVIYEFAVLY